MAATAGLSLTLDPMGKMFQNGNHLVCPGMNWKVLYKFLPIGNKMAATAGHRLTLDPMGFKCLLLRNYKYD